MIIVSNSAEQVLTPGQSITFDTVLLKTGNGECCKNNVTRSLMPIRLRNCGNYEIHFNGNATNGTADSDISLAIQVEGVTLPETLMRTSVPVALTLYANLSATTVVTNDCNNNAPVTVTNVGTTDVTIAANSALFVKRIS